MIQRFSFVDRTRASIAYGDDKPAFRMLLLIAHKQYMPTFYLAGKFHEASCVRALAHALPSGCTVTAPWYDFEQTNAAWRSNSESEVIGQKELDGVVNADYYVGIINDPDYAYKGTLTEMGIALGWHTAKGTDPRTRVFLITPTTYTNTQCVALRVPHTALATQVPIMVGTSIIDNIPRILAFINGLKFP